MADMKIEIDSAKVPYVDFSALRHEMKRIEKDLRLNLEILNYDRRHNAWKSEDRQDRIDRINELERDLSTLSYLYTKMSAVDSGIETINRTFENLQLKTKDTEE